MAKDIISPETTMNEPKNAEDFEFTPIYDIEIDEPNLLEYWYSLDNGALNHSITE